MLISGGSFGLPRSSEGTAAFPRLIQSRSIFPRVVITRNGSRRGKGFFIPQQDDEKTEGSLDLNFVSPGLRRLSITKCATIPGFRTSWSPAGNTTGKRRNYMNYPNLIIMSHGTDESCMQQLSCVAPQDRFPVSVLGIERSNGIRPRINVLTLGSSHVQQSLETFRVSHRSKDPLMKRKGSGWWRSRQSV